MDAAGQRGYDCPMSMTLATFRDSVSGMAPPDGLSRALQALWHDARDEWDTAHGLVDDSTDPDGCEVHGYLHRREGDDGNAAYWYRHAGRPVARGPLDEEWQALVQRLVGDS